jgi:ATP-dependent exoDNAse (exonuclease V) beta subunit
MLKRETLLRRLHVEKETEDSIQDELNLYYVALTRAKYALHLIAKDLDTLQDVRYARSFADFTDFSVWEEFKVCDDEPDIEKPERQALVFAPNEKLVKEIKEFGKI